MPEQDVIYLTEDFIPVDKDDPRMAMVKVRQSDGKVVFGFPEGKAIQNKFEDHAGRPGKVGGSLPRGESSSPLNNKQLFHYTDEKSADAIHSTGFTVRQEGTSALLGRGVFFTDETGHDNFKKDFGKVRVEAKVKVKNTLEIDGGYLGYFNWVLEEAEKKSLPSPNPEDIANIVSAAGYDSVWIKGSKKGNIYIVFDTKDVEVTGVKKNKLFHLGGKGSGFKGHSGRPGQVGGSSKMISSIRSREDTMDNPFNQRVVSFLNDVGDDVKANVELSDHTRFMKEPAVYFNITVPEDSRGKGYGSQVMKELMSEADKAGVLLVGDPEAFGQGKKMNTKQLWGWYQSLGFKKEGGQVVYRPAKTLKMTMGKFHE